MLSRFLALRTLPAALALVALACPAAPDEHPVALAPHDWQHIRVLLDSPAPGLRIRSVQAQQAGHDLRATVDVEVAFEYSERADNYRRYFRTFCSNATGPWKCDPKEDIVEPAAGGAVELRGDASPHDVVSLARYLGHAPGLAGGRELVSVHSAGNLYHVGYRMRGCYYFTRLRREDGDLFIPVHPNEPAVAVCP